MSIENNVKFFSKLLACIEDADIKLLIGVTTGNVVKVIINDKMCKEEVQHILTEAASKYHQKIEAEPNQKTDK